VSAACSAGNNVAGLNQEMPIVVCLISMLLGDN
jgi:hypothetical protein